MNFRGKPKSTLSMLLLVPLLALFYLNGCDRPDVAPFTFRGVRLLDETERVTEALGPPAQVVRMDYWTSWRYPDLGLTLDFAPVCGVSPGQDKVIWAMCSQGSLGRDLKVGSPSDVFTRRFPGSVDVGDARFSILRHVNAEGHRLDAVISERGTIEAFILSLPSEMLVLKAEANPDAEAFAVGGVKLMLSSDEVRSLLGDPDAVREGFTGNTSAWAYWERGLTIHYFRYKLQYVIYSAVLTRGGHPLGITIGSSVEEVNSLMGPPERTTEDKRIWHLYDPLDNNLQVIAVGERVISISVNLPAGP